jgi:hypothetical protein
VSRSRSVAATGGGLILGVMVSVVALFIAVHLVGPASRALFGEPFGYDQDHATRSALTQATAVRVVSLAAAFVLVGVVLARFGVRRSWAVALVVANPVTVGFGYATYQALWSGRYAGEYFGYGGLGMIALAAPLVLAPCLFLGLQIARPR